MTTENETASDWTKESILCQQLHQVQEELKKRKSSRELSLAITKFQEFEFWLNEAIRVERNSPTILPNQTLA